MSALRVSCTLSAGDQRIVEMTSSMLLMLRAPRIEEQTVTGVRWNPGWCRVAWIKVGSKPPLAWSDAQSYLHLSNGLGTIFPEETLSLLLVNTSTEIRNVTFVVEGDVAKEMHWGATCGEDCPDCRWRTECHHTDCEHSPEMAKLCAKERQKKQREREKKEFEINGFTWGTGGPRAAPGGMVGLTLLNPLGDVARWRSRR